MYTSIIQIKNFKVKYYFKFNKYIMKIFSMLKITTIMKSH